MHYLVFLVQVNTEAELTAHIRQFSSSMLHVRTGTHHPSIVIYAACYQSPLWLTAGAKRSGAAATTGCCPGCCNDEILLRLPLRDIGLDAAAGACIWYCAPKLPVRSEAVTEPLTSCLPATGCPPKLGPLLMIGGAACTVREPIAGTPNPEEASTRPEETGAAATVVVGVVWLDCLD